MKRDLKNDGIYVEINASDIVKRMNDMDKAKIVVLKSERIEFAGDEKNSLVTAIESLCSELENEQIYKDLEDDQRSDFLFRRLILRGCSAVKSGRAKTDVSD